MKRTIGMLIALIVISVCATAADCNSEIKNVRDSWINNWNAKQLGEVMKLYAEDSTLLSSDGQRIVGRENIRPYFQKLMDSGTVTVSVQSVSLDCSGDFGYDAGMYKQEISKPNVNLPLLGVGGGATKTEENGNYLVVLKRISGEWHILQHASIPVKH